MTQPAVPAESLPAAGPQPELWKPLVFRAAVALAFGALTIFWATPSVAGMGIAGGVYLAATGILLLKLVTAGSLAGQRTGRLLSAGASAMIGAGVAAVAFQGDQLFAIVGAVGLGVLGVTEIAAGILGKGHVLARDWLVSGVIALGTAALLPFFIPLGAHALLGVAGGGAILAGVLWMLSGLTIRHEAAGAARRP
ncbi:hypothetical protein V1638_14465 [Pseudarthrobacter sp. J64]|uniref:hypothetical protein n=1 Tax=Pseudarthrobacter sp. J64 TaxID=3116485 RepID=UPI002E82181B|nr:hypothetical protein [Pseudarthrobacter sp. J64]MEE2570590.1 hypothetical protein [Pseudarthrobacter sp. J64]